MTHSELHAAYGQWLAMLSRADGMNARGQGMLLLTLRRPKRGMLCLKLKRVGSYKSYSYPYKPNFSK